MLFQRVGRYSAATLKLPGYSEISNDLAQSPAKSSNGFLNFATPFGRRIHFAVTYRATLKIHNFRGL